MSQTEVESHKARKRHRCDWCWQHIEIGEAYSRYRYFDSGDAMTIRAHPECYDAIIDAAREEGGQFEWTPGQERPEKNSRGGRMSADKITPRTDANGVVAILHRDGYWTNQMPEQDPFPYLSQQVRIEVCLASAHAAALEENAKLRAEVERLREDAGRYRYLRDIDRRECLALTGPAAGCWIDAEEEDGTLVLLTEADADAAIDSARAAK